MLCTIIFILIAIKMFTVLTKGRCKSNACLIGKTALITGGNSGIGLQAALMLAARGCRIIIADKDDATKSKERIIKETNNSNIVTKLVDFSSFKTVRALAKDINETEERLDILINNAGIGAKNLVVTEDKLSRTLQVNFFSHFLLTHLLIDLLKKSAPSRIIFTSSNASYFSTNLTVSELSRVVPDEKEWQCSVGQYGDSKLLLAIVSKTFSERLEKFGVTSNAHHPGCVTTSIFSTAFSEYRNYFVKLLESLIYLFGKNIEEGAQTMVHVVTERSLEKVTGKFFMDCIPFFTPLPARNKQFRDDIWKETEKLVKLQEHEKIPV